MSKTKAQLAKLLAATNEQLFDRYVNIKLLQKPDKVTKAGAYQDEQGNKKVDEQLLKLAKANKGAILTLDYNLIKVAEAEKTKVLNINDLALAVRTEFLPGEKMELKITEKGSNRGQGIGYLPNGTMVVVEKAANKIGKTIIVEFVRFHETSAGKMIFAKIAR